MSLRLLPAELVDSICSLFSPRDLTSFAQTSSFIAPVAQRWLYRHLYVSPARHNLTVVRTLAKRPDIAHFVRSFSVSIASSTSLLRGFYRTLALALSHMSALVELDIFIDPGASWVLPSRTHSFPRLLHFACSFSLDSNVLNFLETTEALLELEVDSLVPRPETRSLQTPYLPQSSLPKLVQFIGPSHAALAVVPGRPVSRVHLDWGDLSETVIERLAESKEDMLVLSASMSCPSIPSLLTTLSERMPHLVYLRLTATLRVPEADILVFYESVAQALTALPDLKAFEFSGMHWGSTTKEAYDEKRIWQSRPLGMESAHVESNDLYSDIFFAY